VTFVATTRVDVLRGSTVDPLGDESGGDVEAYTDRRASIIERTRSVLDPSSGEPRTIRKITGRLDADVELEDGDRIRDRGTGKVYVLEEFTYTPRSLAGQRALVLDLRDN
jgi:hypothetical protein